MHSTIRNQSTLTYPYSVDVYIYLTKRSVLQLVKGMETYFHTEFTQFSGGESTTIEEKLTEYNATPSVGINHRIT